MKDNALCTLCTEQTKVCNKPVAKYDTEAKKAYIEYPDGMKKYIE